VRSRLTAFSRCAMPSRRDSRAAARRGRTTKTSSPASGSRVARIPFDARLRARRTAAKMSFTACECSGRRAPSASRAYPVEVREQNVVLPAVATRVMDLRRCDHARTRLWCRLRPRSADHSASSCFFVSSAAPSRAAMAPVTRFDEEGRRSMSRGRAASSSDDRLAESAPSLRHTARVPGAIAADGL